MVGKGDQKAEAMAKIAKNIQKTEDSNLLESETLDHDTEKNVFVDDESNSKGE